MRFMLDLMLTFGLGWWVACCSVVIVCLLGYVVFDVHRERKTWRE